jgi:integrase
MLMRVPKRWLGLVALLGLTGLRWGEASALRWEDLKAYKVEGGPTLWALRVRRNNWKGIEVAPKTKGSSRDVPVPAIVVALLGAPRRGLMFPTRSGALHRGTPLRAVLTKACEAAEVTVITPHGLRRTFNDLARRVASREVVKSVTGHATDVMLEHYSLVDIGEKAEAVDRVTALLAPLSSVTPTKRVPEVSRADSTDDSTS